MPILLFLLWIVFNERMTTDVLIAGVIVVVLLSIVLNKVGLWKLENDSKAIKNLLRIIAFYFQLVAEVIKANFHMIALVLSSNPEERISPKIVKHKKDFFPDFSKDFILISERGTSEMN